MDVVKVRNESEVFRLKDAFDEVLKFFGENSKTTPPSVFFPVFVRFVKAYRVSWNAHKCTQKVSKTLFTCHPAKSHF